MVTSCNAAHLVPQSRPDASIFFFDLVISAADGPIQVYSTIDGGPDEMFSTKAGILLDRDEHGSFEALEWSLYFKVRFD